VGGRQWEKRELQRRLKEYPSQTDMLTGLIREATHATSLPLEAVFSPQVEDLISKVAVESDDRSTECFEEKTRHKSQLLNVAFGSVLQYFREGQQHSEDFANVVGLLHWFSAGLLEGSLRALEHQKEKQATLVERAERRHAEDLARV